MPSPLLLADGVAAVAQKGMLLEIGHFNSKRNTP